MATLETRRQHQQTRGAGFRVHHQSRDAGPAGLLAVQGGAGLRSALVVPLQIDDETSGLLVAGDPRPGGCDPGYEPLLQAVGGRVASALHTARLLERAEGTNAELLELDRLKSGFISIVSHDFRSPLTSIILAAKGLQRVDEGTWRESIAEHLEIIVDQATRLSQLAEDTLSITRIESGQLSYYFSIVDLERVIADAVAAVPMGPRHVLEVRVDPGAARVKADAAYALNVILVRVMGTAETGHYVYALSWFWLLALLPTLGLGVAVQRFVPQSLARGEPGYAKGSVVAARRLSVGMATATAAVAALVVWLTGMESRVTVLLVIALVALPIEATTVVNASLAEAQHRYLLSSFLDTFLRPVLVVVVVLALVGIGLGLTATDPSSSCRLPALR